MKTVTDRKKLLLSVLLSAGLAGVIFIVLCAINEIAPLGTQSIIRNDGIHQYAPFLANFVDKIKNGGSLLYSWNLGGGTNQLALICYYLLSPFNLLALPFNSSNIDIALWLIILVKTMCIAAAASFYFQKKTNTSDLISVAFSLIYTFGGFYIAYYYNTMWLDALMMLPLIALGIENIVNGKKAGLYFISLAYAIFVNFYIGYMLCIFSVLYFFYLIFAKDISRNSEEKADDELPIMQVMTKFGISSLFAGLVCAVTILPVIYAISNTLGRGGFDTDVSFFNILDFLSYHLSGTKAQILETTVDTAPYVMSSMLTFLTVPAFFLLKNVKPNKKVATAVVLAIFYFSFTVPKMNAFWHGFSAPLGLPYRFSFIYLFFIIILAYEVVRNLKNVPVWAFGISAVLIVTALVYTKFTVYANHFNKTTLAVSIIAAVLYFALLLLMKYEKIGRKILGTALCLILVAEILMGNSASIGTVGKYDDYFGLSTQIAKVNEIVKQENKNARVEILDMDSDVANKTAMYSYNGVSVFSSLADSSYVITQNMFGNTGNYKNSLRYMPQTPVYNAAFSLGYVYDVSDTVSNGNPFYEKIADVENGTLYKVKYTLPMGYCVNSGIEKWDSDSYLTLGVHNTFWGIIAGQQDTVNALTADNIVYTNCNAVDRDAVSQYINDTVQEVEDSSMSDHHDHDHEDEHNESLEGAEEYIFTKDNLGEILEKIGGLYAFKATADGFSVSFEYTAREDGEVYALANSGCMQKLTVVREDGTKKDLDISERHLSDIGFFQKGEKYTLTVSDPDRPLSDFDNSLTLTDSIQMTVASINEQKFLEGYNKILENGVLDVKEFDDTYIYGTVNAKSDCVMMMPMPYDEGWTVYVDGEPVELLKHTSHIMMFELAQGEHEIELSYFPLGLREGMFVSIASVLGVAMVLLLGKVHKMKKEFIAEEEKKETEEKGKE